MRLVGRDGTTYNGDVTVSVVYYDGAGEVVKSQRFHPFEHEDRDLFLRSAERVAENIIFPTNPRVRKAVLTWTAPDSEVGIVLHAPEPGSAGFGF